MRMNPARPPRPRYSEVVKRVFGAQRAGRGPPRIGIVPFVPGWRPTDEATRPGLGSSDQAALLLGPAPARNRAFVLFSVTGDRDGAAVDATLSFRGARGDGAPVPVHGWDRRPVPLRCFGESPDQLRRAQVDDAQFVLTLEPESDLEPVGDEDPFGFANLMLQRLDVQLRLLSDGVPVSVAHTTLDVCDVRRLGSLYERVMDGIVAPDADRQAAAADSDSPGSAYHPWFPVLLIGSDKARLYTRALVADIVDKQRYLADPSWLLRVGLYLELLTCLGIIEATRAETGDLLTPAERVAFESDRYAPIRSRLNPDGWREVWALRQIAFPRRGIPRAGPVSVLNPLNKKRATVRFLHVHHEDLKQAVALAGPNRHDAQETWQRVFRDAERAVLRQTPDAFPELGHLPPEVREFVLWHRRGHLGLRRVLRVPGRLAGLLGDQDGLFASACNQYRASMNHVADWAQARGLMDHTGEQSVPRQVSLLEAHMNQPSRVALLQGSDGYALQTLEVGAELPDEYEPPLADVEKLLAYASVFTILADDEIRMLARTARPLTFGPMERIIVQGEEGDSLFVVVEGDVEVVLRREDGSEASVDTMRGGTVVGEMSMLTGERRSATVRAIEGALVYEIGRHDYAPLLSARPQLADELRSAMQERLRARREYLTRYDADQRRGARKGIRRFLGAG